MLKSTLSLAIVTALTATYVSYDLSDEDTKDIHLSTFTQPDPDQLYFVQIEKKSKEQKELILSLTYDGIIISANKIRGSGVFAHENTEVKLGADIERPDFNYYADHNFYKKTDTIKRRISIDTVSFERFYYNHQWVEKNPEQKAREAAEEIKKIREGRFLLLTGYQEVDYGESMAYMDGELKKMEAEYLALFTGKITKKYIHQSFTFLPEKGKTERNIPVFKFSEREGLFDVSSSNGIPVFIKFIPNKMTKPVADFIRKKPFDPEEDITGFYYRIPEYSEIQFLKNGEIFHRDQAMINQFGTVSISPSLKSEIEFHPESGNIKNIIAK